MNAGSQTDAERASDRQQVTIEHENCRHQLRVTGDRAGSYQLIAVLKGMNLWSLHTQTEKGLSGKILIPELTHEHWMARRTPAAFLAGWVMFSIFVAPLGRDHPMLRV